MRIGDAIWGDSLFHKYLYAGLKSVGRCRNVDIFGRLKKEGEELKQLKTQISSNNISGAPP